MNDKLTIQNEFNELYRSLAQDSFGECKTILLDMVKRLYGTSDEFNRQLFHTLNAGNSELTSTLKRQVELFSKPTLYDKDKGSLIEQHPFLKDRILSLAGKAFMCCNVLYDITINQRERQRVVDQGEALNDIVTSTLGLAEKESVFFKIDEFNL